MKTESNDQFPIKIYHGLYGKGSFRIIISRNPSLKYNGIIIYRNGKTIDTLKDFWGETEDGIMQECEKWIMGNLTQAYRLVLLIGRDSGN